MTRNLKIAAVAQLEMVSFHSNLKKGNANECSNYQAIALISHANKEMLKILQARLQQYVNHELPDIQFVSENTEEPKIKFPTSAGSSKKASKFQKNI